MAVPYLVREPGVDEIFLCVPHPGRTVASRADTESGLSWVDCQRWEGVDLKLVEKGEKSVTERDVQRSWIRKCWRRYPEATVRIAATTE